MRLLLLAKFIGVASVAIAIAVQAGELVQQRNCRTDHLSQKIQLQMAGKNGPATAVEASRECAQAGAR